MPSCQIAFTSIRLNQISAYSISIAIFPVREWDELPGILPIGRYTNCCTKEMSDSCGRLERRHDELG